MYLATTESPLSVTVSGGEALICPSVVLGGEEVPELDGQDSSNSSGDLGPVARALGASGSLDLWDLDELRVPISHHVFLPSSRHSLATGLEHSTLCWVSSPWGARSEVASTQGAVPQSTVLGGENWQAQTKRIRISGRGLGISIHLLRSVPGDSEVELTLRAKPYHCTFPISPWDTLRRKG